MPQRFDPKHDVAPPPDLLREEQLLEQLPQVRFIARRIHDRLPQHVDLEDLIQAGVVGLIDAFRKFDPSKNVQFKSYAAFRIRGAILDSLRDLDWGPRELRRKSRGIEEAIRTLCARLKRTPTDQETADELHLPLAEYLLLLGQLRGLDLGSMHGETGIDGVDEDLSEQLPDESTHNPLEHALDTEQRQLMAKAIDELPEKERQVLALYYYEELTMKEIGVVLGVVES